MNGSRRLCESRRILAFERRTQDKAVKVIANFGESAKKITLTDSTKYQILLSNKDHINMQKKDLHFESGQVVVMETR